MKYSLIFILIFLASNLCYAQPADFNPHNFGWFEWGSVKTENETVVGFTNSSYSKSPLLVFEMSCKNNNIDMYIRLSDEMKLKITEPWVRLKVSTNLKDFPIKFIGMHKGNKIIIRDHIETIYHLILSTKLKRSTIIYIETEAGEELGFISLHRDKKGFVESVLRACNKEVPVYDLYSK